MHGPHTDIYSFFPAFRAPSFLYNRPIYTHIIPTALQALTRCSRHIFRSPFTTLSSFGNRDDSSWSVLRHAVRGPSWPAICSRREEFVPALWLRSNWMTSSTDLTEPSSITMPRRSLGASLYRLMYDLQMPPIVFAIWIMEVTLAATSIAGALRICRGCSQSRKN